MHNVRLNGKLHRCAWQESDREMMGPPRGLVYCFAGPKGWAHADFNDNGVHLKFDDDHKLSDDWGYWYCPEHAEAVEPNVRLKGLYFDFTSSQS